MSRLSWSKLRPMLTVWTLFFVVVNPTIGFWSLDVVGNSVALADEANESNEPAEPRTSAASGGDEDSSEQNKNGLDFRIYEGSSVAHADVPDKSPVVNGESLSEEETNKLLKLLPPLEEEKLPAFVLPGRSVPPPNSQHRLQETFPPAAKRLAPPQVKIRPLKLTNKRPTGMLERANEISLSFSEPMVPISTQEQVAANNAPVKMTPDVPGEWVWYGTQTLTFRPKAKSLPMATTFVLTVPKDTKSVSGAVLEKEESWSFSTAAPRMTSSFPDGNVAVRPTTLIMGRFNQKIDRDALLKVTHVVAGKRTFAVQAASDEEIAADPVLKKRYADIPSGMALVLKTTAPLPANSTVQVTFGPGIKSAEGPLLQDKPNQFRFRTYGPFTVTSGTPNLSPYEVMSIEFSNPIDRKSMTNSTVTVTPPIPDMKVVVYGTSMSIQGPKPPRSKIHVEFARALKDVFGQSLSGVTTRDFQILPAAKDLYMQTEAITLPSKSKPHFCIQTINLDSVDFKVYSVSTAQFKSCLEDEMDVLKSAKLVHAGKLHIKNVRDHNVTTAIDLSPWLKEDRGTLEFEVSTKGIWDQYDDRRVCRIQCTNLALNTFSDGRKMYAWTTDLETGTPVRDAAIHTSCGRTLITNADGMVSFASQSKDGEYCVYASHGKDEAFGSSVYTLHKPGKDHLDWYIVTDRSPYRPGETVNVKGIVRKKSDAPSSQLSLAPNLRKISYEVLDNRGTQLLKGNTDANQFGAFDLSFKLPSNANLGYATLALDAGNSDTFDSTSYRQEIPVQEFRRPEFEVNVKNEGESVQVIGGSTTLSATTSYYSGGGLPSAPVSWNATASGTTYSPPGWTDYSFGRVSNPIVWFHNALRPDNIRRKSYSGKTDKDGKSYVKLDFLKVHPVEPTSVAVTATVVDVNRQAWTDTTTLLVHPSKLYVGEKLAKPFVKKDVQQNVSIVVTDIDGKAQAEVPVKVELSRKTEALEKGEYIESKDDVQNFEITSKTTPVDLELSPKFSGLYCLKTIVVDKDGHANETETEFWVAGGEPRAEANPEAKFHTQDLLILPEKKHYSTGDEAKLLIESPFAPANGVARICYNGIAKAIPFRMDTKTYELRFPVTEESIPSLTVAVDVVGHSLRSEAMKAAPAEAIGSVELEVSSDSKRLSVEATPDTPKTEPGKDATVTVKVTDHDGKVVPNAEVSLAVVDDALLSLVGYKFKDPIEAFYSKQWLVDDSYRERETLDMTSFLLNESDRQKRPSEAAAPPHPGAPENGNFTQFQLAKRDAYRAVPMLAAPAASDMAALPPPSASAPPPLAAAAPMQFGQQMNSMLKETDKAITINLRSNFDALAKWAPSVITNESGTAVVKFKLPDNLTRYRIMVVASHGADQFGTGESSLTARLPLMLKPSAPRFLNYGDSFELPLVIHNQTDAPIDVNLAARATNIKFIKGQGRHTTVPPNDRIEVRLPAETQHSGKAKFQAIVACGTTTDAAQFDLPVYTPATTEAFATYGQLDKGAIEQQLVKPEGILPDIGELQITTSSTILETLTDAFLYVQRYPHECSEQISSRLIAISLLKDVLKQFHVKDMPTEAQIKESASDALTKLKGRQRSNGGFALWSLQDKHTYPYVSLYVVHALLLAKQAGYDVPESMLNNALEYVRKIDNYLSDYKGDSRLELKAFAYYLLDMSGSADIPGTQALYKTKTLDKTPLESIGWYLSIFCHHKESSKQAGEIHNYLANLVTETASTADIVRTGDNSELDYSLMWSPMRTKGLLLDALIKEGKSADLATKLMRTVLGTQHNGRWSNTQENVYVLQAIKRYFDAYEKTVPDFVVQSWLGNEYVGESTLKGRSNDYKTISIPMSYIEGLKNSSDLILEKKGDGRAYYRLGLSYAPKNLHLSQMDRGFHVNRTYEGVKNKDDVTRDKDGKWHFKAGSLVKVKLTLSAPGYRFFVAMVDPIPAGSEILNEDLKGTEQVEKNKDKSSPGILWWWWIRNWWDYENKRDNQAEVFSDSLSGGSHEYSYVVRATTPGSFVVPPTKAEEMYAPETFGRAQTEMVVVE
ncbi:MAG TPA: alpha-2-macroglobulin family protein [Oculatellaceae cyanobacterium]